MARQQAVAEVNAFVKGLITEASPLTFPENASIDEVNLIPQKDGSRKRRLGMDFESGHVKLDSGIAPSAEVSYSSYSWKAPGGYTEKEFAVIQIGGSLQFFDTSKLPLSSSLIYTIKITNSDSSSISTASVDGVLIVVDGSGSVYTFDYNGTSITQSVGRLLVRDLFGVGDSHDGIDLLSGSGVAKRPSGLTNAHIYNLRNQTFASERYSGNEEVLRDTIELFRFSFATTYGYQGFPSNSDNVVNYLYPDANDSDDRNTKRYFAKDALVNPLGTNRSPVGYFIIDALNRGASRLSELRKLEATYQNLTYPIGSLPADITPGGASVITAYAGRVFYSGFSSQVVDGDSQSPRMTSYILFSKLVQSPSDVFKCYQEGDPTSSDSPELVDTDGGFLRIDGAYNIQRLINVGDALMAIAENGVWKITGGSGYGFKATDYVVAKVTEHGTVSPNSAVLLDNTLMYWSDDGIYHVAQNQYGDWAAQNLTTATVQGFYDDIPSQNKKKCFGAYDAYTRKVRWLYNNFYASSDEAKELILDVGLGAFYTSSIKGIDGNLPVPVSTVRIPPFQIRAELQSVINNDGASVINFEDNIVVISEDIVDSSLSELYYVILTGVDEGSLQYTFGYYRDTAFLDWKSYNNTGLDAAAYLVTGWTGMGDFQRNKQMSYLTVYSMKTEVGFDTEFNPINPSSIKVQGQWSWTNSAESSKWTQEFQAYRHSRLWIPSSISDGYDDGELVVTTKNKLRGRGKVLSLKFSTEPGKDFHLLGWSYLGSISGTV